MYQPIQLSNTIPSRRTFINRSLLRRRFLLIPLAIALSGFVFSPMARAEDEDLGKGNTAEGKDALSSITTGINNTAIGFKALHSLAKGSEATATGSLALSNDRTGYNTAYGFSALYSNTTGIYNTATGRNALYSNTTGNENTATGGAALVFNTTGSFNTGIGRIALYSNTTGIDNTATGFAALYSNTTGDNNTATGSLALVMATGNNNTAFGHGALFNNTTGQGNIALGFFAGSNLTTGSHNIDIGTQAVAGESSKIRIGTDGVQKNAFIAGISGTTVPGGVAVIIDTTGHLGTVTSSERFKDQIKPMDRASEAILALKPVTFRYKHELDPESIPQFGLVAEQVEKVNRDLVARDDQGKAYTVRYEAVNAMLLNEFLKEHRKVQQQEATINEMKSAIAKQEGTNAQQQKQIEALTVGFAKVSEQLELSRRAPQLVADNQ